MKELKGMIICGFPGVGKTAAAKLVSKGIVDCDSTPFHFPEGWNCISAGVNPGQEDPNWVKKYVDHIEVLAKSSGYPFILCASHYEVRKELRDRDLPYIVVVPKLSLRDEYMTRYLQRGNDVKFISKLYNQWFTWLNQISNESAPIIYLHEDQFISDILPSTSQMMKVGLL